MGRAARAFFTLFVVLFIGFGSANAEKIKPLKAKDVENFMASVEPVTTIASDYWGKRRYSKKGKIIGRKGSFERAMKEMTAAGKIDDFNALLRKHGFDSYAAWRAMGGRIANAQMLLMMKKDAPIAFDSAKILQQARMRRKEIVNNTRDLTPAAREQHLKRVDMVIAQYEQFEMAKQDKEIVEPYLEQLKSLGRARQRKQRAARDRKKAQTK